MCRNPKLSIKIFPLQLHGKLGDRPAILLKIEDQFGNYGIGESAPLPAFGTESFAESLSALSTAQNELMEQNLCLDMPAITSYLQAYSSRPATRHAIEQALLSLLAHQKQTTLAHLLAPTPAPQITINGLIGKVSPAQAVSETINLLKQGITCIKVKVGGEDFRTSYDRLLAIQNTDQNRLKLRIDPNQTWTATSTIAHARQLARLNLDYLEQPTPAHDLNALHQIKQHTNLSIALDESVRTLSQLHTIAPHLCADYLILKPMLSGGILPTHQLGQTAHQLGLKPIVTNTLDGIHAWRAALQLALALRIQEPCGLATISRYTVPLNKNTEISSDC